MEAFPSPDQRPDETPPGAPVSRAEWSLELPDGVRLHVTVESDPPRQVQLAGPQELPAGADLRLVIEAPQAAGQARQAAFARPTLAQALFGSALLVYLLVRLIGLERFPIYFFSDEAVQTMLAADLLRDGLRGADLVFLPTYFKNGSYYNLSTSVYLQVLPYLMFGKSVWVTRGTAVLATLLAAFSAGWMLRDLFGVRRWWLGPLLLSLIPAWFLHSRTAFETALYVSFYAAFLYTYGLYRLRSPQSLYAACLFAALAFYSYSPGQVVVAVTALLLLISDAGYHWQQRRLLRGAALLVAALALPYLRFQHFHSGSAVEHLRLLGSYWVQPLALSEKLSRLWQQYSFGLSPGYWFVPHEHDLARHLLRDYGHLPRLAFPLIAAGLALVLRRFREPQARLLLAAVLAAPAGGALVGIGITRLLSMVIPAALLAALCLDWALDWLERRIWPAAAPAGDLLPASPRQASPRAAVWLSLALFAGLAAANLFMLRDVLVNGPFWYRDYGLGGLQYGAQPLFDEVRRILRSDPETIIQLSPNWTNGADVVARFFLWDPLPIQLGSVSGHIEHRLPLEPGMLFIVTPEEYRLVNESAKFKEVRTEKVLPYPDGRPGFYFLRLTYIDNIEAVFAAEQEQRRQLQQAQFELDGETVAARTSRLDIGTAAQAFDGDPATMLRTEDANPAVVELTFPRPRTFSGISVIIGSIQARITVLLYPEGEGEPLSFSTVGRGSVSSPELRLDFPTSQATRRLRVEVLDINQDEPAHVHIWEIKLDPP